MPVGARVNMMIENDVLGLLQKIPAGQRSHVVNLALRDWFKTWRRQATARKIDGMRKQLPRLDNGKIIKTLKMIRSGH